MELSIKREAENKLIGRSEVKVRIEHANEPTPSREIVRDKLAAQLNKDAKLIIIPDIKSSYGYGKSKCTARIYKDEAALKAIELPYMLKRHAGKQEEKKEAPAA